MEDGNLSELPEITEIVVILHSNAIIGVLKFIGYTRVLLSEVKYTQKRSHTLKNIHFK